MSTDLVSLPEISDELTRQLRIRQYRVDAGMSVDLEYHPDAASTAARLRARMGQTSYAVVRRWLNDLVSTAAVLPREVNIDALAGGIAAACKDFPASVWNADTLCLALQTIEWLRSPAQVYKLIKPEADKLTSTVEGLEAIAKAKPAVRAVPSPIPYVVASTPDWVASKRVKGERGRPELNIQPPRYSIAEQVALMRSTG